MVSIIQKLGNYSFGRWLLCSRGLYRYLYPDNNELKNLAGVPKDKSKSKKGHKYEQNGKPETFYVPRSLEIQLETSLVTPADVVHLRFYTEYQWMVDFTLYSLIVYILSEVRIHYVFLYFLFYFSVMCLVSYFQVELTVSVLQRCYL